MTGYGRQGPSKAAARKQRWQQPYKITKNRISWCKTALGEFIMMRHDLSTQTVEAAEDGVQPEALTETGDTITLMMLKTRGKPISFNLTGMTQQELLGVKQVLDRAFAAALPICIQRDEDAKNAFAEGDDSYQRLYRPVPEVFVRERKEREHSQGVRDGHEDLLNGDESSNSPELRDESNGVAD